MFRPMRRLRRCPKVRHCRSPIMPCRCRVREARLRSPRAQPDPVRLDRIPTRDSPRRVLLHKVSPASPRHLNRGPAVRRNCRKPNQWCRRGRGGPMWHRRRPGSLRRRQDPFRRLWRPGPKSSAPSRRATHRRRRVQRRRWRGPRRHRSEPHHHRREWPRRRQEWLRRHRGWLPHRRRDPRPRSPVRPRHHRDRRRLLQRSARRTFRDAEHRAGQTPVGGLTGSVDDEPGRSLIWCARSMKMGIASPTL